MPPCRRKQDALFNFRQYGDRDVLCLRRGDAVQGAFAYQQAEAGDGGKGGGHGGAGELELAEVADEHERHQLDDVLQEVAGDERPGKAQLPLDLSPHQAFLLASVLAPGDRAAPAQERLLRGHALASRFAVCDEAEKVAMVVDPDLPVCLTCF